MSLKSKSKMAWLNGIVLLNFAGQPVVELKDGNARPPLKENLEIKSDTYIKTAENEYIIIKINNLYKVTILPESVFTVEGVKNKGDYDVRSINVRSGKVHLLELPKPKKPEKSFFKTSSDQTVVDESAYDAIKIDSDFFSILTEEDQKLSLLVDSNPKNALLEVCNFSKDYKLYLFNHETPQTLKTNEGIQFQGVLDSEGKVAYDLLLQKRKVPQGKWLNKKPCEESQVKKIQEQVEKNRLSENQKNEKIRKALIAKKKRDDDHFLCHKPYGQLNQCHFILQQKRCYRTRCNAEGKWAEKEEISTIKNHCTTKGEVKSCDY